jgi:hypothetical protein
MPTVLTFLRYTLCVIVCCLALTSIDAPAQEMPAAKITGDDIRRALIWTGHFSVMSQDDPVVVFRKAFQSWQTSKGYAATETLPNEHLSELLSEGAKQRDAFGWTTMDDKAIGFSIGVPTKLVKFVSTRNDNGTLLYDFEGSISYSVAVRYGDLNCGNMNFQYARLQRITHATYKAHGADWYAMAGQSNGGRGYFRAVCRTSGIVLGAVGIAESQSATQELLFSAMADSLLVGRSFNPTGVPHPKVEQPTPTASDFLVATATRPQAATKPSTNVETTGKTDAIKRETREGAELSVEQVFEKVSPAVYVVKAGEGSMGSAVAISANELLTNCHIVKGSTRVTLAHDKKEQPANVVSVNAKADRCVLWTAKLDKWVTVRPYDDIKIGERALTIGTPQGLELTVAEGIVSAKRTHENQRLIQTTASISQGSSGGGLFDAQGHLLGITTFYLKVGQNLNFAVAAEEFAK